MLIPSVPISFGLAAALTWGAADFAGGLAARRGRVGGLVLLAHGTSAALLAGVSLFSHEPRLTGQAPIWALASGVAGGVGLMLFYKALALGEMGLSAALAGVLTAALPVTASLVKVGRPGGMQLAGFLVAAAAIALISWAPSRSGGHGARTLTLATLAGLGFGMQLLVLHVASEHGSILRALTLSRTGGAAAGLGAMLWAAGHRRRVGVAPVQTAAEFQVGRPGGRPSFVFAALALLAGLLDTSGNGLYMASALVGRLDVAAVLASLYPGVTILLAAWLLRERATSLQTAGMVLALAAVVLISL